MKYTHLQAQYDSLYASVPHMYASTEPLAVVTKLTDYLTTGHICDIGAGEGRNACYLAKQGYAVTAQDISPVGLAKLANTAKHIENTIDIRMGDITTDGLAGMYDACLITFVLHHLTATDACAVLETAQKHTNPGGFALIVTFSDCGKLYERNATKGRYYPSDTALAKQYTGWHIHQLEARTVTTHARDASGTQMTNEVVTLLAQKPHTNADV